MQKIVKQKTHKTGQIPTIRYKEDKFLQCTPATKYHIINKLSTYH